MSNVGAKVPVYEDVSGGPMSLRLVELRSDLRGDVILDVIPLERGGGDVDLTRPPPRSSRRSG